MSEDRKFYQTTWFIVLSLIFFFPLGLILMWRNKKFGKTARIVITVIFAFVTLSVFIDEDTSTEFEEHDKAEVVSKESSNEEEKNDKEKKENKEKEAKDKKKKEEQNKQSKKDNDEQKEIAKKEKKKKNKKKKKEKKKKETKKKKKKEEQNKQSKKDNDEQKEIAKKEKKKEKITIDEKIEKDSLNVDKASLKNNVLTLKKEPSSTWSENTLVKNNVFTMFEDVNKGFNDKNVNEIKVIIEAVMIDEKGNEEVVSAVEYEYDRSTFEELNYDNFIRLAVSESWRILNESDAYLIYPGIYKALKQEYKQGLKDNGMKIR